MTAFNPYPKPERKKKEGQTHRGFSYGSEMEANHARRLDKQIGHGEVKAYQRQFTIHLKVNGHSIIDYAIDFRVEMADGSIEYHEVKGVATTLWWMKWRILKATIKEHEDGNVKLVLIKK